MNDLMPPPRRRMPDHDRHALHQLLQQPEASATPLSRSTTPWLAAAAVAVIAVGGYGLANMLGDSGGDADVISPAGQRSSAPPTQTSPTPTHRSELPPTKTVSTVGPSDKQSTIPTRAADEAYDRCINQVDRQSQVTGTTAGRPQGRVVATFAGITTVVVSDGTSAWACNVEPDLALSHPVPDSAPQDADAHTFAFALNDARNVGAEVGDLAWAGGVLPKGVSELTYVFPDGHSEPAVTKDGYWVMQYLSEKPWGRDITKTDPVQVQLTGPGGDQTVAVPLGPETVCNQVTHGC